jgi:CHAT domain-containing protein
MNSNTNKYNPQALIPYQQQKIQQLQQKKQALQQKITADEAYDYVQLQTEQLPQEIIKPTSLLAKQAQQMDLDIAVAQDLLFNLEKEAMQWASGAGVNEKRTVTRTENTLTTESTLKSDSESKNSVGMSQEGVLLGVFAAGVGFFIISELFQSIKDNPAATGVVLALFLALIYLFKGSK